jgi:cytochrome b561
MQVVTASPRYTRVAIFLHWIVAVLIVFNVVMIWTISLWPEDWDRPIIDLHKSIGITVLGLVLMRILWRIGNKPPPLPQSYPAVERHAAHAAHAVLYVLILAIPISGWMHDSAWKGAPTHPMTLFGLVPWPRIAAIAQVDAAEKERLHTLFFAFHQWFAYALYGLVGLHVAAALKHQWIDKKPELQRMAP